MNMRERTMTVRAGVPKDDYLALQELAKACPHARGSVRMYTGNVLIEHIQKTRAAEAASVSPGKAGQVHTKERPHG